MTSKNDLADFLEFETDHLLSKWGFQDGEMLNEPLERIGFSHLASDEELWYQFTRRVLCEFVERTICVKIKNQIKPYRVVTSHNPIRIYEVDGTNVSDLADYPELSPQSIRVPLSKLKAIASELELSKTDRSGAPTSYMTRTKKANEVYSIHGWD